MRPSQLAHDAAWRVMPRRLEGVQANNNGLWIDAWSRTPGDGLRPLRWWRNQRSPSPTKRAGG